MSDTIAEPASGNEDSALPEYPMPRASGCPFDPPPELIEVAESKLKRVRLWDGSEMWLALEYETVRNLFNDPRISSNASQPGYPHETPGFKAGTAAARTFVNMDDPEHALFRKAVLPRFTNRQVELMRPEVEKIVDGLIDDIIAGPKPADLVRSLALPIPSLITCLMMGVAFEEHEFFQETAEIIMDRASSADVARDAQTKLLEHLRDLIEQRLTDPGDDVLSDLATKYVATGKMTLQEAATTGRLLLIAGHETTANQISLGILALLQHPDQMDELAGSNDPRLVANAVEEMLRHLSIVHIAPRRVAAGDIEIGGVTIKEGDGVGLGLDVSNRDPRMFPNPDVLDIHRDAKRHLAFGFGIHQCLGQAVARVELQTVFGRLFRRIPTLRLAVPLDEVSYKSNDIIYGLDSLPVSW